MLNYLFIRKTSHITDHADVNELQMML